MTRGKHAKSKFTLRSIAIAAVTALIAGVGIQAVALSATAATSPTWGAISAGERSSILTVTSGNSTTSHNGSEWYYRPGASMGFAPAGATVALGTADAMAMPGFSTTDETTPYRVSWHLNDTSMYSGFRTGGENLMWNSTVYRAIYQADTLPSYYPSGPQLNVAESSMTGWTRCYLGTYNDTVTLASLWTQCTGTYLLFAGGTSAAPGGDSGAGGGGGSSEPSLRGNSMTACQFASVSGGTYSSDFTLTVPANGSATLYTQLKRQDPTSPNVDAFVHDGWATTSNPTPTWSGDPYVVTVADDMETYFGSTTGSSGDWQNYAPTITWNSALAGVVLVLEYSSISTVTDVNDARYDTNIIGDSPLCTLRVAFAVNTAKNFGKSSKTNDPATRSREDVSGDSPKGKK